MSKYVKDFCLHENIKMASKGILEKSKMSHMMNRKYVYIRKICMVYESSIKALNYI